MLRTASIAGVRVPLATSRFLRPAVSINPTDRLTVYMLTAVYLLRTALYIYCIVHYSEAAPNDRPRATLCGRVPVCTWVVGLHMMAPRLTLPE